MLRRRVIGRAALLAVAASFAVPAVAEGALPPIKVFPKFYVNGLKATTAKKPFTEEGGITLEAPGGVAEPLSPITCKTLSGGSVRNEVTEGTEKGLATVEQFSAPCTAFRPCTVKNTRGEAESGIFLTAETPPVIGGSFHNVAELTGISTLPWNGEAIERETEKRQLLIHHVKFWLVLPAPTVGEGQGCLGEELEYEDKEGATEKNEQYELAPYWINGSRNGLKPSHMELIPREGLAEISHPTGRLSGPQGEILLTAPKLFPHGANGSSELITLLP